MRYLSGVVSLKLFEEKCSGCGRCVEVCPRGVLGIRDKKVFYSDIDLCMECGACVKNCAFGAISVNAGVGCAAAIINSMITGGEPVCGCSGNEGASGCC